MSRRKKRSFNIFLTEEMDEIQSTLKGHPDVSIRLPKDITSPLGTSVPINIGGNVTYHNPHSGSFGYAGNGGVSGNSGGNSTNNNGWAGCNHPGKDIIYTHEESKKELYAAKGQHLNEFSGAWDLIIDLASIVRPPFHAEFLRPATPKRFSGLKPYITSIKPLSVKSEILPLDWPDMSAPPCSLDFWITLWDLLPAKTVACCVGGHGRTGTCLASLLIAAGETYYDAISIIREKHCNKAIESLVQELYLHTLYIEMLNRNVEWAKASSPDDTSGLEEDLTYALAHPPNNHDSYGIEKEPPMRKGNNLPTTYVPYSSNRRWNNDTNNWEDIPPITQPGGGVGGGTNKPFPPANSKEEAEGLRLISGIYYIKECVKSCAHNCIDESHFDWVEWKYGNDASHRIFD